MYPITVRLDKFIHQNLEAPFHLYKGNYEHGTAKSSLLLADYSEGKTSSYQSSSTSGRDHVDAGHYTSATSATGRWATSRRYLRKRHFRFRWTTNASFPWRRTSVVVSVEPRRTQERLHHQPGRELGLGECPTVRAFTLPTWRWTVTPAPACGNRRYTLPIVPSLSRTVFCGKDFQKREDAGDKTVNVNIFRLKTNFV